MFGYNSSILAIIHLNSSYMWYFVWYGSLSSYVHFFPNQHPDLANIMMLKEIALQYNTTVGNCHMSAIPHYIMHTPLAFVNCFLIELVYM